MQLGKKIHQMNKGGKRPFFAGAIVETGMGNADRSARCTVTRQNVQRLHLNFLAQSLAAQVFLQLAVTPLRQARRMRSQYEK